MHGIRKAVGLVAVAALSAGGLLISAAPTGAVGNTLQVPSALYPTIQSAVDAATAPATTIIVQPDHVYYESIVIMKNGITIKGAPNKPKPVIMPPDGENACAGFFEEDAGICVLSFDKPVKNIEIANLEVRDFAAFGIFGFNVDGLNIHDNAAIDNGVYGIARFDSSHTQIVHNWVSGSGEAGIYVGDSPNASTLVRQNTVTGNGFGIFLRDSLHGTVTENNASGNCIGILLIDSNEDIQHGGPSLPAVDWTLVHNNADDNTLACDDGGGDEESVTAQSEGPPSGVGIVIAGAAHARATANHTTGNSAAGIVVMSSVELGGTVPTFVQVDNNELISNGDVDLVYDGSGSHVTFAHNSCLNSDPLGLCP